MVYFTVIVSMDGLKRGGGGHRGHVPPIFSLTKIERKQKIQKQNINRIESPILVIIC